MPHHLLGSSPALQPGSLPLAKEPGHPGQPPPASGKPSVPTTSPHRRACRTLSRGPPRPSQALSQAQDGGGQERPGFPRVGGGREEPGGMRRGVGGQEGGNGQLEMNSLLEAGANRPHPSWVEVPSPGPCRDPKAQLARLVISAVGLWVGTGICSELFSSWNLGS